MALLQNLTSTMLKQDLSEIGVYIGGLPARKALAVMGDMCLVDSDGNEIDMTDLEVDLASVGAGSTYIGKDAAATGGDFTVTYTAATQLTLSDYPAPYTGFTATDIEFIRQINAAGVVVATYTRDDTAMAIAANVLTVTGAVFTNTDTFVVVTNIPRIVSSAPAAGGGKSIFSNAQGDFTATPTNGATTITITGLPFTLEAIHVLPGFIIKKTVTTNVKTVLNPTSVSVAAGVITLGGIENFVTGDEVTLVLIGPDKAYDQALNTDLNTTQNPDYGHYTDVEHIIDEEDLGLSDTDDGDGDATHIEVDDSGWSNEVIAVGYNAYSIDDSTYGVVASCDTDTIVTAGGTIVSWAGDVFCAPEVKRYEMSMDSYKHFILQYKLAANDGNNSCYLKVFATINENADTTDDTDWVDISEEVLTGCNGYNAATYQIEADGIGDAAASTQEDVAVIDMPSMYLKYMIKIVAECEDATPDNDFDVYIRKYY